ncbi:flagellar hook-length control protein FliK [Priestia koreensis]|uniref:flagellar hook-length control protein FliK n=1 Tax=Priestia koreensis TaxID=284581 RepID=UPI0006A99794|nr:flagellar hook-length control protein FliK [Priestia koreensis]
MEINGTMSILTNGQMGSSNDTSKAPSNLFQGLLLNATSSEQDGKTDALAKAIKGFVIHSGQAVEVPSQVFSDTVTEGLNMDSLTEKQQVANSGKDQQELAQFLEALKNEPVEDESVSPTDSAALLQMISVLFSQPESTKEVWSKVEQKLSSLNDKEVIKNVLNVLRTFTESKDPKKMLNILQGEVKDWVSGNGDTLSTDQKRETMALYSVMKMIETPQEAQQLLERITAQPFKQSPTTDTTEQSQGTLKQLYPKNSGFKTWQEQVSSAIKVLEEKIMPSSPVNSSQVLQNKLLSKSFRMPTIVTNMSASETKNDVSETPILQGDMSKVQQLVLHVGANATKSEGTVAEFVKDFEAILSKGALTTNGQSSRLLIKLNPEHLGNLQIELVKHNDQLVARILTSTSEAKELIESQLQALKQTFQHQHLAVDKLEVQQQFQPFTSDQTFKEGQNPSQEGKHQQSEPQQEEESLLEEFEATFQEALLNTKV